MPFDIGIGIIVAICLGQALGIEVTPLFIMVSVAFSLGPDIIDGLPNIRKMLGGHAHEHREGAHYPLVLIPVVFLLALLLPWGIAGAFILTLLVIIHFVHDMIGVGWGIQVFRPFSKKYLKLFTPDYREGDTKRKLFAWWTKTEMKEVARKYGREDWILWYYARTHPGGYIEWIVLIIGVWMLVDFL